MKIFQRLLLLFAWFCLSQGAASLAIAAPEPADETISGEITRMRERGADLEIILKADVLSNVSGGLQRGTRYLDNWDVKLRLDGEKLWRWEDSSAFVHLVSSHGSKFNTNYVGSSLGVDNIEVRTNTTKLFHAWLQKGFFDKQLSLLAGLYGVDSEFYVTDTSGVFLHPSFGMAPEVSQTGVSGPPIFPTSGVGVRALLRPHPAVYLQAAVVDGVPGDPNNPHGTHIRFDKGDGAFVITEFGFRPAEIKHTDNSTLPGKGVPMTPTEEIHAEADIISKYAVGYWYYTSKFNDLVDVDAAGNPLRRASRGAYFLAEQTLIQEEKDPTQGLAAFLRYGVASSDSNVMDYSLSFGVSYKGLLPGRGDDVFGVAMGQGHAGDKFRRMRLNNGIISASSEWHLDLTYRIKATPWLAIQPSVQRIINPGFNPAVANAWIIGTRFEVIF